MTQLPWIPALSLNGSSIMAIGPWAIFSVSRMTISVSNLSLLFATEIKYPSASGAARAQEHD